MIGKFVWKLLFGFFVWVIYTIEILWILTFIEEWLSLGWITVTLEGSPFFNGIGWFGGFIIITLLVVLTTAVLITEPDS